MFGKHFVLDQKTLQVIEQIGEHMPGGFFIYQASGDEKVLYANKAVFEIFGCRTSEQFRELTGGTFGGMVYPEDYKNVSAAITKQVDNSRSDLDYVEYRIIRRDGEIRWIDDYGHYVQSDAYGGIYYVFISDITEKRIQYENDRVMKLAVINALSRQYNTVWLINDAETESFSLFRGDREETGIHYKPIDRALKYTAFSQAINYYINNFVSQEDRDRLSKELAIRNIVYQTSRKSIFSVMYRRLMEEGERYYRIEFAKVELSGGKTAIVSGFKDVDDEVRREQEIQQALRDAIKAANASNKAKSDFLSTMSHDIRTPMNAIIGMTAIAAAHIDDKERVSDCLKKITESSGHLLSLINEVLDMNKIESGKIELCEEEFDLSELIDKLITMTRVQMNQHGHTFHVNINEVRHENVIGDIRRIQQVFVNLMSNAIKYTPDGGTIDLTISELPTRISGTGCYEFVFEDNGYGMTPEFLEHLFEPFTRADDKKTAGIEGTGLGMAITKNIVQMMDGTIKAESKYGEGSKFTVTLYLKQTDAEDTDYSKFEDLHILVADDDPISCESACGILNDIGMTSEWVLSGKAAVERVRTRFEQGRNFYAVIIDWKMPDMDGVETTRRIRKLVGDDTPIIIFSAYDWSDIEQQAREAGANAFISKPLFKTKLVRLFKTFTDDNKDDIQEHTSLSDFEKIDLSGRRVLLAEDIDINAQIAEHILNMTGVSVERACDGAAAVEMLRKNGVGYYDLVFMDIQMPNMDGYEAAGVIRSESNDYMKNIPIIAMTANAFEEDIRHAVSAGMNGHIAKPLDFAELSGILKSFIS